MVCMGPVLRANAPRSYWFLRWLPVASPHTPNVPVLPPLTVAALLFLPDQSPGLLFSPFLSLLQPQTSDLPVHQVLDSLAVHVDPQHHWTLGCLDLPRVLSSLASHTAPRTSAHQRTGKLAGCSNTRTPPPAVYLVAISANRGASGCPASPRRSLQDSIVSGSLCRLRRHPAAHQYSKVETVRT